MLQEHFCQHVLKITPRNATCQPSFQSSGSKSVLCLHLGLIITSLDLHQQQPSEGQEQLTSPSLHILHMHILCCWRANFTILSQGWDILNSGRGDICLHQAPKKCVLKYQAPSLPPMFDFRQWVERRHSLVIKEIWPEAESWLNLLLCWPCSGIQWWSNWSWDLRSFPRLAGAWFIKHYQVLENASNEIIARAAQDYSAMTVWLEGYKWQNK